MFRWYTISKSEDIIRGWCWRTKSCPSGMAWGCVMGGASKSAWGSFFYSGLQSLRPKQDLLIAASSGKPLIAYCAMLGHFRRILWIYGGLSRDQVAMFSHSCKCTLLSWANQLLLDEATRAKQGHHVLPTMSKAVPKYGRDDIVGQIRCQREVLAEIHKGWIPCTPLNRGLQSLPEKLDTSPTPACDEASDTEPESDSEEVLASSQSDSGSEDSEEESPIIAFDGPWMMNIATGWYHKAIHDITCTCGGRPVELSAMPKPNSSCGRQTRASKAGRLAHIVLVSPRAARLGGPMFAPADDRMSVDELGVL